MSQEFQPYLDQVTRHVERDPGLVFEIQSELRTHLECAADEFEAQGYSRDQAVEESLKAFGDPAQLALEFKSTYGNRPALGQGLRFIALWLAFPLAFLAVQLAWTGIREAWWHEYSGWYGARAVIHQATTDTTPDPQFLPRSPDSARQVVWSFIRTQSSPVTPQPPRTADSVRDMASALQAGFRPDTHGFVPALTGALYARHVFFPSLAPPVIHGPAHDASQPAFIPSFEPWSMGNRFTAVYWSALGKDPRQPAFASPPRPPAAGVMDSATYDSAFLKPALSASALGDLTGDFWSIRLQQGTPRRFTALVDSYGARFAAKGLSVTTLSADQYIRLAHDRAQLGDLSGAQALLDDADKLIARHMAELPPTRAILPLAVFRLIYLPDCREGILGPAHAGPGPDPLALAALSREMHPFQSPMYLPGVRPRTTPLPPGPWAQLAGWSSLISNLLVVALACMVLVLAVIWFMWAIAALFDGGRTLASHAPGLLPHHITRIEIPAALALWAAAALFYAGLFANPLMRFEAPVWKSYPVVILLSAIAFLALSAFTLRRELIRRGIQPPAKSDNPKPRANAYLSLFAVSIILPRMAYHLPDKVQSIGGIIALLFLLPILFLYLKFTLGTLTPENKTLVFIHIRSLRLALGLAVALLAIACLILCVTEQASTWAAWQSTALNQPVSDEFKREVLGLP